MNKLNTNRKKYKKESYKNIPYNIAYHVAKYGMLLIPIFIFLFIANIVAINTNLSEPIFKITIYLFIASILILLSGLICAIICLPQEYRITKDKNILAAKYLFYLIK